MENINELKRVQFLERVRLEKDEELEKLLRIQKELEQTDINEKNVYELTKNLSGSQKSRLQELYENQISDLKNSLNCYKNKIIKLRKDIKK